MSEAEKRILVVDDDDAIRALLFTILRRRGFAIDAVVHGEEAVARLRTCRYAIVLLDLMMPVMNGWQVLEWLETLPAADRPMVIVLTAGNEPRSMDPGIVAGTIRKPFDIELLVDMVSGCLAAVQAREQAAGCPPAESDTCDNSPRGIN